MSTLVMNSAMMSADGHYTRRQITEEEFVSVLLESEAIVSSIGYPAAIRHIERIAGITLSLNRNQTILTPDDTILVLKLKYRIENPAKKKHWIPRDEDYEYFLVEYYPCEYHRISIDVDYDASDPYQRTSFGLFIDGFRWLGCDEDQQRIALHVWKQMGKPDLINDEYMVCMTFNSDDAFTRYIENAMNPA